MYRMNAAGEKLDCVRIDNEPMRFADEVVKAPAGSEVVIEATYGWYGAADRLQQLGYVVHLAHPRGNEWGQRRVKNDERDARDLADLLRLGRLAEAWIAPPATRELREMVRFRAKLSNLRTGLKAQLHAVLAKNGVLPCRGDMWGIGGAAQLDALELPAAYTNRIEILRDLVTTYDREITFLDRDIHLQLRGDPGYEAVQAIYGVGRVFAAVFVAEIGALRRRRSTRQQARKAAWLCMHGGTLSPRRAADSVPPARPVIGRGAPQQVCVVVRQRGEQHYGAAPLLVPQLVLTRVRWHRAELESFGLCPAPELGHVHA
jgi:transposase